jgi:hypothetical protein
MIFINDSVSSSLTTRDVERICTNLINKNEISYRKDIFSTFKNYMKYDPELVTFRKIANEKFCTELDLVTNSKLSDSTKIINETIDTKISQLVKTEPVDLMVKKISTELEPQISQLEHLSAFNVGLGITNMAILGFFIFSQKK